MSIAKALSQAPSGIDDLAEEEGEPIEIEIEDPESVKIHAGDMEIDLDPHDDVEDSFADNLAEYMNEGDLQSIASELIGQYDEDISSRKDWIQTYVDGLELLGMKIEERSEPWEGACGVYHPLLSEALVKFQAETMMSTFPAMGPVKTQIIGKETPEKKEASERVQDDMNYQLTDVMKEYRPEHERMLWGLGLAGNAFKKVYYDPHIGRQVSLFVPAEDIVVPYGASNLESAERVTHTMRKTENELRRLQEAGFYCDVDLGEPNNVMDEVEKKIAEKLGFRATSDTRYKLLEMHVDIDLAGFEHIDEDGEQTGIALPYVVTLEKGSGTVLAIRRNWEPDDKHYRKRQHFVHYGYVPGFGFYCFGLLHLVGAFAKSGTSIIRQLVDAGTLSNLPGGFKARGMRVKGDDTPIAPGEFRDVDVPSGTIRDNLMPLPYKEPSATLFQLLQNIVEEGRRFANTADLQISDMSGQAPVGTTLAILERTLKVMSAVQARIHYSMKQELGLLKDIIAEYCPKDYNYDPEDGDRKAKKSDYSMCDVIPVSDPNASTMAQKIVQYQAVLQLAQGAPQLYNLPLLHRQMLDVLGVKNAAKLVPLDDDKKPADPVSENQNILMTKPVKAFAYQNHQAHIQVHMSAMQDPKIMQLLQNNPQAPQLQAAMMAHINEHLGFEYRVQIEQQLGFALPPQKDSSGEDIDMDPQVEAQLAPMLAQAAQQLLQNNQSEVAQAQARQQQQDPLIQMQQQELQLKQQALQMQGQKDQAEMALKQRQQQDASMRAQAELQLKKKQMDIDALKTAAQIRSQKDLAHKNRAADLLKHVTKLKQDKQTQERQTIVTGLQRVAEMEHESHLNKRDHIVDGLKTMAQMRHDKEKQQKANETKPTQGE